MTCPLYELAAANREYLEAELAGRLESLSDVESTVLREYSTAVEASSRIAVSTKISIAASFLSGQPFQNVREWAEERAILSGRSADEVLAEKLGDFLDLRLAFERRFSGGSEFYYAALVLSGLGASKFGEICLVFDRNFPTNAERAACLKHDSLSHYQGDNAALERDLAPYAQRGLLAALKLLEEGRDLSSKVKEGACLCSDGRYIEVIFNDRPEPRDVAEVRIAQQRYKDFWDLSFAHFGRPLNDGERAVVEDFVVLLRAIRAENIVLSQVEQND